MINSTKHPLLEAAYLYYYATDTGVLPDEDQDQKVKERLSLLITDSLVVANNAKFDVFNALTLMDNVPILQDLKVNIPDVKSYILTYPTWFCSSELAMAF